MKKYQKPQVVVAQFSANQDIAAGLSTWLATNGLQEAGITTYEVMS